MSPVELDDLDYRILDILQQDASLTNAELAQRVHASAPTCLRRVKRLRETGVIRQIVALLDDNRTGPSLTAIVEVTLDRQDSDTLAAFEAHATQESAVLQCYRVSPGPDFILQITVADMPAYHALAHKLFASARAVRNVRAFFATQRAKFEPGARLSRPPAA